MYSGPISARPHRFMPWIWRVVFLWFFTPLHAFVTVSTCISAYLSCPSLVPLAMVLVYPARVLAHSSNIDTRYLLLLNSLAWSLGLLLLHWILLYPFRLRRSALTKRHATRRADSQCVRCGYDLRATPDHCPECGTAVVRPAIVLGANISPLTVAPPPLRISRRPSPLSPAYCYNASSPNRALPDNRGYVPTNPASPAIISRRRR
jgi:hypothetical protein